MAITVAEILTEVRDHYSDLSASLALTLLGYADHDIRRNVRLDADTTIDLVLVSGTQEYALSSNALRVWEAAYLSSAGNYTHLIPTSVDEQDYESPTWRNLSSATPYTFYERGGKIGLIPAPNTASSGGYPTVRLYVASYTALGGGDSLPAQVHTPEAWVYGILWRYAMRKHRADAPGFFQLYRRALDNLTQFEYGINVRDKPHAAMGVPEVRNL